MVHFRKKRGGGQHLERPNVFRNLKISNITITKDEFFDFLFSTLFFHLLKLFEDLKCMIIFHIDNIWNIDSFPNCQTLKTCLFSEIVKLTNFQNF